MYENFPLRTLSFGLVALFVWWWVSTEEQGGKPASRDRPADGSFVSAVQPIGLKSTDSPRIEFVQTSQAAGGALGLDIAANQFEQANAYASSGKTQAAIQAYRELLETNPQLVEVYINLAAVLVQNGQTLEAQEALTQGIESNANTAVLFANLKKILGALAAQSYQAALEKEAQPMAKLQLPMVDAISAPTISPQQIQSLQKQLDVALNQVSQSEQAIEQASNAELKVIALQSEATSLQTELQQANTAIAEQQQQHLRELARLQVELTELRDSESLANVTSQRAQKELSALQAAQTLAIADARIEADALNDDVEQAEQDQNTVAVALVRNWARAWSEQSVEGYVNSYIENYTPSGSGLSRSQWLEQRQQRIGNKSFIDVAVSDFSVVQTEQGFDVNFSQHYRSDTMDDRIRKRLMFAAADAQWLGAKIIGEEVVGR